MTSTLRANVHVTDLIPINTPKRLPFGIPATLSHISSTLIHGDKKAVLVYPFLTIKQGNELAAWIKGVIPNKKLTTVYITHGHGDHYFAPGPLLKHFPETHAVTTPKVIEHMEQQEEPEFYKAWWQGSFPDQLDKPVGLVQPLAKNNVIDLEGHELRIVEAGDSDTYDSTFLHVPDLSMVVAGDICYNDLHQCLQEATTEEKRNGWIASLDKIAALRPSTVIAGHKRPGAVDGLTI